MKVKILNATLEAYWYSNSIGEEFDVIYVIKDRDNTYRQTDKPRYIRNTDCVITELPESFCVKRCDDNKKWYKYLEWLVKQKNYSISMFGRVFVGVLDGVIGEKLHYDDLYPFGTEIHIDDMIKHIDYMENNKENEFVDADGQPFVIGAWYQVIGQFDSYRKCSSLPTADSLPYLEGISLGSYHKNNNGEYSTELSRFKRVSNSEVEKYFPTDEFDLTTNEGRLAYARKHYPIGTKVISLFHEGNLELIIDSTEFIPARKNGIQVNARKTPLLAVVYEDGKWAEIIKEEDQEFDLTTNEGRLAYARKYYPIGTKYIPLYSNGESWNSDAIKIIPCDIQLYGIDKLAFGYGYIYANGKWAEIVKDEVKEEKMEIQKLSRQGLKEIHGVACSAWKQTLEQYGSRTPLEDYIELTREEVNKMFNACTKEQLPIVSKYLKKDDLLDFDKISGSIQTPDGQEFIGKRVFGAFENKSFYLHKGYDWEIKEDDLGELCLIPTKKK